MGDLVGGNKVRSLNTGNRDVGSDDVNSGADTREIISRVKPGPLESTEVSGRGERDEKIINARNYFKTG